jgi:transposase
LPFLAKGGGEKMKLLDKNSATFFGIDAHPTTHTALAINRFEEEKGILTFDNTKDGIAAFLSWLPTIEADMEKVIIGLEGGGNSRHALVANLLKDYQNIYEVNPLFTKQRRMFGTKTDKSDPRDAKLIAEVLTRKLSELPKITKHDLSVHILILKKTVWFYEETTAQGVSIQNQLHQLKREADLSVNAAEKKILRMMIADLEKQLKNVRKTQKKCADQLQVLLEKQGKNLTSIKGIKTILSAKIVAHSGGIERFANLDSFIQYAGIAPREKSSGKLKRHSKGKAGSRKLNHAFYLAAMVQLRWSAKSKEYFDKKIKEGKTKKHALKCLMKRIACITYGMLRSGEEYRA